MDEGEYSGGLDGMSDGGVATQDARIVSLVNVWLRRGLSWDLCGCRTMPPFGQTSLGSKPSGSLRYPVGQF
jgi:hypothetical protein